MTIRDAIDRFLPVFIDDVGYIILCSGPIITHTHTHENWGKIMSTKLRTTRTGTST